VIDSLSEAKAKGGEDDEAEQTEVEDKRKGKGNVSSHSSGRQGLFGAAYASDVLVRAV
jgi:hypothetical protein